MVEWVRSVVGRGKASLNIAAIVEIKIKYEDKETRKKYYL
jgi:hypothetical protein